MGWRIQVDAFVSDGADGYHYVPAYRGNSLARGMFEAAKAKLRGAGCVKVEWR